MARTLVLGNGSVLVCYDEWGQVRDLYFPNVGLENHVGERLMHRIGVYVDERMHWLSDGAFTIATSYEDDTLVGVVRATSEQLGLELVFQDVVYNEHDIFVRRIELRNTWDTDRTVKLFFNQQFHISEADRGDTAYYSPELRAVVHYKGRRVFLVSAQTDDGFFDDYSVGLLGIEGKEGTWRDAEDGMLSRSGIEHGSVDSVIGCTLRLPRQGTSVVHYWLALGETYGTVERHHRDILTRGPEHLRKTTGDFWRAWVHRREFAAWDVEQSLVDLYRRSLLVMRTHTDNNGAIIASGDSCILQNGRDTYSYCWPRDAGYIVLAFLEAGHVSASRQFHTFISKVLTEDGYLLHKYRTDGSLGSSWHPWVEDGRAQPPIQEDETAMTLITLGKHYEVTRDVEYIESLFNSYIKRAADFMVRFRDRKTGLPLPSHDLWEEQRGVFTYSASVVYAALDTAAMFAKLLGKEVAHTRWKSAASEVRRGIEEHLLTEHGVLKQLAYRHGAYSPDATVDVSSFYGLFRYGVLPADDPRMVRAYEVVRDTLTTDHAGMGVCRYEGDRYFAFPNTPSNPWLLTTCWLAEYEIARASHVRDLELPKQRLMWVRERANTAGLLGEQYAPDSYAAASVLPLVWSHAQYILTFLAYTRKIRALSSCD